MGKSRILLLVLILVLVFVLTSCKGKLPVGSSSLVNSVDSSNDLQSSSISSSDYFSSGNSSSDYFSSGISSSGSSNSSNNSSGNPSPTNSPKPRTFVSQLVNKNGRTYVEYLDNPYLMYGVQIRLDNLRAEGIIDTKKWEELFAKTKDLNFQTIACQVVWTCVEYEKDKFDFYELGLILKWCNKYDLNLQIIWFGSNVAGGPTDVPKYILNDRATFPRNPLSPETHLDYSSPNLIAREQNAMNQMMKFIEKNDPQYRVVMVQVNAEPDNVQGISFNWNDPVAVAKYMWGGGQADASINMMDKLGQVIKTSNRKVVTRAALIDQSYINSILRDKHYVRKIFDTVGIDLVGIDNYDATLSSHTKLKDYINSEIPTGNIAYTPEAGGNCSNTINQVMHAFSRGEGHLIYELRTSNSMPIDLDTGIFRRTTTWGWVERDGTFDVDVYPRMPYGKMKECKTSEVRDFNRMIYKADVKLASLPVSNIATFNIDANTPSTQSCGTYQIQYNSPTGGEAFAMCDTNGDLILLSLYDLSKFTIQGKTIVGKASLGYYTKLGVWVEESTISASGNSIYLHPVNCVRISAGNIK